MLFFKAGPLCLLAAVTSANVIDLRNEECLCKNDVDQLISAYVQILGPNYTDAVADKYLAVDLKDSSDSINSLAGIPLGSVTFPNQTALVQHEQQQPDRLVITPLSVGPIACDSFAFVWNAAGFGAAQLPVRGVIIITTAWSTALKLWQIKTINVEFNGLAMLKNYGGTWALPSGQ